MSLSADVSPVGWYVGTYQLRFVELADPKKDDPKERFLTWENTALVNAKNRAEAYRKLVALGEEHTRPYKAGDKAVDVQWVFEGVVELVPIHDELGDGAEILWAEAHRTLADVRGRARSAADLGAAPAAKKGALRTSSATKKAARPPIARATKKSAKASAKKSGKKEVAEPSRSKPKPRPKRSR